MKIVLIALVLAGASCKAPKPPEPAVEPAAGTPMEKNRAEKYVGDLQESVKRAEAAKAKADAANKKAQEAEKLPE